MPVHWYYNPRDIVKDFGRITDFQAPKARHPSSIMSLSNTGGAGRGGQEGDIIGDVINHGKKHLWGKANVHYHHGMAAGENTLNAVVARLLLRNLVDSSGNYSPKSFLDAYVKFMRTPGSHNDTYAESYHRMFFKNLVSGKPAERCADDDGHNIASMGGFVLLPPVALLTAAAGGAGAATTPQGLKAVRDATVAQMYCTHNSRQLQGIAEIYGELLARTLYGDDLRSAVADAARKVGFDVDKVVKAAPGDDDTAVIGGRFSPACYIEESFPSLLFLAYKYADSPEKALIANTNVGGENCHRGAALGALMGAAHGMKAWPERWVTGLAAAGDVSKEAEAFSEVCRRKFEESAGAAKGAGGAGPAKLA
jgi:ADP-ribosyl-[dinitrogen reductase] hydrolase